MLDTLDAPPSPPVVPPVPAAILRSRYFAAGPGYGLYAGLPDPYTLKTLHAEAMELYPSANEQECTAPDPEEVRGGKPRRKLITGTAGPIQDAWYASTYLTRFLSAQLGLTVVPAGNRGGYSYYVRPDDFLDLHRDVDTCDVTAITVLYDNTAPTDLAGSLVLYPGRLGEPLSALRARPDEGACPLKLQTGQTAVIFGGVTPHRVHPVSAGQIRIVSALCFRALI